MPIKKKQVYLMVGTKKGGFLLTSDRQRKRWKLQGPFLKGGEVNDLMMDVRQGTRLYACVNSYWWGPDIHMSDDLGNTWKQSDSGVRFDEKSGNSVSRVWCIVPGNPREPEVLYAGVDPAALFVTRNGGMSWSEVQALSNHPTRSKWSPGAGGLMVHSICPHPLTSVKMLVGISAAGVFATDDGGVTWEPRNNGVLADFLPEKYPHVGQCVHHLEVHAVKPHVLYQQNHCGVYRSDNEGRDWVDISAGLPSRFGFPIQIHPNDPDTVHVIPEEGADFRASVNGEFAVYKSTNRGETWKKLNRGLPRNNAYLHVHRQAMKMDDCDPSGLYVGASSGQIFYSRDGGKSWDVLIEYLPFIYSLSVTVA